MYLLAENNILVKYPYTVTDLKRAHPSVSFPAAPSDTVLETYGMYRVFELDRPEVSTAQVAEKNTPVFNASAQRWEQPWLVREKTVQEVEQEQQQTIDGIVAAVQEILDTFAKARNYDGILSLCTYASSTVPKFQSEGKLGVEARDNLWTRLYEIFDEVKTGARPMPAGITDIVADLPIPVWEVA